MKNKYMHRSWLGAMCLLGCSFTYAAEEQFNDALNAANSGNTAL